jgi:hypothetical protein
VDDWEQHFVEKSRRRFDKERHERLRNRARLTAAIVIVTIVCIGALLALAVWA